MSEADDPPHKQPFRQYSENPSWLAVKPLEGITLTSPPPPLDATPIAATSSPRRRRPIVLSTSLLPVTYNSALTLVPPLHEKGHDLIIHVGVGSPGEIKLEQRARRWGYEKEGADGEWAPQEKGEGGRRGFVGKEWDLGDELKTKVRGEEVVRSVRGRGVEHVGLSEDAGMSLAAPRLGLTWLTISDTWRRALSLRVHLLRLSRHCSAQGLGHPRAVHPRPTVRNLEIISQALPALTSLVTHADFKNPTTSSNSPRRSSCSCGASCAREGCRARSSSLTNAI